MSIRDTGRFETTPILDGALTCVQPADGYRFAVDSLLLAHFALSGTGERERFVELGSGCGIVSALLAAGGFGGGVALELDPDLHRCTLETLRMNGMDGRAEAVCADLRTISRCLPAGSSPVVVSNPPFHKAGQGRTNRDGQAAAARHELTCTMDDVLSAARWLLPPGGRLLVIYPARRLAELMERLPRHKLRSGRLRLVHPVPDRPASHLLLEARKGGRSTLLVDPPLAIRAEGTSYDCWYSELRRWCSTVPCPCGTASRRE